MSQKSLFWFQNVEWRTHPWPGLNWLTTIMPVPDVKKARDLYVDAFDFVSIYDKPDPQNPEKLLTTRLRYRGNNILLVQDGNGYELAPASTGSVAHTICLIYVDNAEESYKKALKLGMTTVREPHEAVWGDRMARVRCPFGYVWELAHRI